jgi:hypothetical protein
MKKKDAAAAEKKVAPKDPVFLAVKASTEETIRKSGIAALHTAGLQFAKADKEYIGCFNKWFDEPGNYQAIVALRDAWGSSPQTSRRTMEDGKTTMLWSEWVERTFGARYAYITELMRKAKLAITAATAVAPGTTESEATVVTAATPRQVDRELQHALESSPNRRDDTIASIVKTIRGFSKDKKERINLVASILIEASLPVKDVALAVLAYDTTMHVDAVKTTPDVTLPAVAPVSDVEHKLETVEQNA